MHLLYVACFTGHRCDMNNEGGSTWEPLIHFVGGAMELVEK